MCVCVCVCVCMCVCLFICLLGPYNSRRKAAWLIQARMGNSGNNHWVYGDLLCCNVQWKNYFTERRSYMCAQTIIHDFYYVNMHYLFLSTGGSPVLVCVRDQAGTERWSEDEPDRVGT